MFLLFYSAAEKSSKLYVYHIRKEGILQWRRDRVAGLEHESMIIEKISFYVIALAKKRVFGLFCYVQKSFRYLFFQDFSDVFQFFCSFHSQKIFLWKQL